MEIKEVIYNAKTKKTEVRNRVLSKDEIAERDKAQKQMEDEQLMLEFLREKEKAEKKEKDAEFEAWKAKKKRK